MCVPLRHSLFFIDLCSEDAESAITHDDCTMLDTDLPQQRPPKKVFPSRRFLNPKISICSY